MINFLLASRERFYFETYGVIHVCLIHVFVREKVNRFYFVVTQLGIFPVIDVGCVLRQYSEQKKIELTNKDTLFFFHQQGSKTVERMFFSNGKLIWQKSRQSSMDTLTRLITYE